MISIIKQRNIWFSFSAIAVIISTFLFLSIGLDLGIDFTGGSILELEIAEDRPTAQEVSNSLAGLDLGDLAVQPSGDAGLILRFKDINENTHQDVIRVLNNQFNATGANTIEEKRFDSIGPSIGEELRDKTVWAIGIVILAIIFYIAWAFRKVSEPVASWKYGVIAIIALFHDVMITIGVFVILGQLYGVEVNAPFVAALLTILGYSVNDTIVVFDRTRENLTRRLGEDFEDIVKESVNEVITRSINSSFTTLLVLFAILLLGGQTIRSFVLTLIIGIGIGTYSSIFLASPLLVVFEKIKLKR